MNAADNRAAFPETAKIVDDLRAVFGPEVKLTWVSEGGREIGTRGPAGVTVTPGTRASSEIKKGADGR